ncbi:glycosyltransferase family 4 protein [Photobacterium damselae]|uniref:glycosyltransferase family 4 protein n=1 Tax=Photobacterium damselae TaxID=38293 RepID=UPI000DFFBA91|nr:glycosyltransferase family 4 protein [Photobacterium damselae]SUB65682.1 UDP-D-galactose:(glucosyl)lipopolysaccharide-1,6-D-galactosyltransferase [Photobacterium damselae]
MKILLIGPFPEPIHGMSLANALFYECAKNDNLNIIKHDTIFSRRLKSKDEQGSFNLKFFCFSIINMFALLYKLLTKKIDVVYITPGQSTLGFLRFLPVIFLAKLFRKKVVQHIHGSRLVYNISKTNIFFRFLAKLGIKLTNRFIVLSNSIVDIYREYIPEQKMAICLNGVEVQKKKEIISKTNINVLFLSNLMKDKGILDLFSMIEKYPCNKMSFNFAGAIEPELNNICNDFFAKNKQNCTYHGVVFGDKKRALFENSDIFILPSYDEGIPLSILEAYSYSCAVVTTNVGGIPDIFKENENGIFVKPNNPSSIYQALNNIHDKLNFYQETNYKCFMENYTIDKFYQSIKNVLLKVF